MPDPVVTSSPAAAAPAATSTPASSAPASPSPAAAPVETTIAQPTPTVAAQPDTPAAPAVVAPADQGWKGKPRPKASDFQGDIAKHMEADLAWEEANPEGETKPATSVEDKTPEQVAAELDGADKQPDKPPVAEVEAPTPEKIAGWAKEDPEFHAWLEAHPEKKGELFAMSRELERARPIADIFPTVEDATFSLETANRTVSIKSAFEQAIENPQGIEQAVGALMDEFLIVDEKTGQPILDAEGQKQYGEDARLMADYFADAKYEAQVGELKEAIASGKLNEHQAKNYQTALDAWDYLKKFNATSDFERGLPDDNEMDEGTRNWVNQERERIKQEAEKLEGNARQQQTAQQKREQAEYNKTNGVAAAKHFGGELDKMVKSAIDSGVYIPEFLLKEIDPETGVNTFAYGIYDRFMMDTIGWSPRQRKYVTGKGIPRLKEQYLRLSSAKPTEANGNALKEFFGKTVGDHLPKVFQSRLKEIQKYSRDERNRAGQQTTEARAKVAPEISGGAPARPSAMTEQQAMKQATADIDKQYADKYLTGSDRIAKIMERTDQLLGGA